MVAEGHQIASHTWSHQNASQLSELQMRNQMIFNEIAFNDILGFFPTYMRPPYSICEAECQSILSSLGYHIVYFDLDTEGYLHDDPAQIQVSKNIWDTAINGANPATKSFLHIEHDLQRQVVYNLTDHILTSLKARGFRSVTLGECLGDPSQNWYRAGVGAVPTNTQSPSASTQLGGPGPTTSNAPPTPSPSLRVSVDGSCGNGVTCQGSQFGDCCSEYFFCGRTNAYCGAGCNPLFGSCSGGGPPEPPPPTSTLRVSVDGSCGNGVTCQGSEFGNCCSRNFFCGATSAYCGNGCNPQFGTCGTFPLPGGVLEVSTDGSCGNGVTCQGSEFGNCCSEHFFCGANTAYCGTGCRPEFGICN